MAPPPTVRSGNRAVSINSKTSVMATGQELKPKPRRPEWTHTRTALEQLKNHLLCSLCVCILEEPVCLGGCVHVFCRKCVGPSVGNECPVCHMPTWVKDVQINRQLANMIQLCKKLHDVLDCAEEPAEKKKIYTSVKENCDKKKRIRMWFSPRSGKVKCVLDPVPKSEQSIVNGAAVNQDTGSAFAFLPSPPSKESPLKRKKPTPKPKSKKKQLEDINQKWGFGTKKGRRTSGAKKQNNDEHIRYQDERVVSFCSQPVVLCSPEPRPVQETSLKMGLTEELTPSQNGSVCHMELAIQANPVEDHTDGLPKPSLGSEDDREASILAVSRAKRERKLSQCQFSASPASKRRLCEKASADSDMHDASTDHSLLQSPESKSQRDANTTVAQISSPAAELQVSSPLADVCMTSDVKDIGSPTDSLPTLALGSASPASKRRWCEKVSADSDIASTDHSLLQSPESKSHREANTIVAQFSSPAAELQVSSPPAKVHMARDIKVIGSPCPLKLPPTTPATPASRTRSQANSPCLSPSTNLGGKRNFKGETPLHIASIKIRANSEAMKQKLGYFQKRSLSGANVTLRCNVALKIFRHPGMVRYLSSFLKRGTSPIQLLCLLVLLHIAGNFMLEVSPLVSISLLLTGGDIPAVGELLKNGTDPNVKDHAGWTPLHEACNHGHEKVVDLLLQHRALVNTTGYQNDSPLHDAVKNGHVTIVKLLLAHGASRDAVNIFGLRPADYAETEEIKSALVMSSINLKTLSSVPCTMPVSISQQREGRVVVMASGLSSSQQKVLGKLVGILKAGKCTEFNSAVTHIIVADEAVLSTMKVMMGILAGCWVLKFQWVHTCQASRSREPEEEYEMHGGPQRGRLNRENLLPKLLDGCYFYFLGFFKSHCKEDLIELVKAAGGQVLARQPKPESDVTQTINTVAYHAEVNSDQIFCTQYIVYDKSSNYLPERVRQGKVWTAPSSWLIECITSFKLLPVSSDVV